MYLCTHDSPNINQEIMTLLQERLFAMQDKQHAAFQAKLTPGVEQHRLAPWTHNKTIHIFTFLNIFCIFADILRQYGD